VYFNVGVGVWGAVVGTGCKVDEGGMISLPGWGEGMVGKRAGGILDGLFSGGLVGVGLSDGRMTGVMLAVGRLVRVGPAGGETTGMALNWSVWVGF